MKRCFPKDFLWGSAVSAHQIEGGNQWNDWWEFEKRTGIGQSGEACDFCNQYKKDIELLKELNQKAFRISIEWSRIEKEEGKFDEKEIEYYRDLLKDLKENGISTFVTLHHFTNPIWFAKKGGWERAENIDLFVRFSKKVVEEFDKLVDFWASFNEPIFPLAANGWLTRKWPPNKINPWLFIKVSKNIAKAHLNVYKAIKNINKDIQIGIVYNLQTLWTTSIFDKALSRFIDYYRNWWFLDKVINKCDFLGINYYFPVRIFKRKQVKRNGMGWEINARGFYLSVTKSFKRYGKKIYVTENGTPDNENREEFIYEHLKYLLKAIQEGADVKGYFHWSLLDNFEWTSGYGPRFGLAEVDYKTQKRTIKKSGYYYAKIAKVNCLD